MPVPPTLEEAFGYREGRRFVALAYGVEGGVMGDVVTDAAKTVPADLYRQLLLHPAMKPHSDAFHIEVDPPAWLDGLPISESELREDDLENWLNSSRCLLLDRERRQFFVDTVSEVRGWLMLREAFTQEQPKRGRLQGRSPGSAVRDLFAWLNTQSPSAPTEQFVAIWERKFQENLAMRACIGAGLRLGFQADELQSLVRTALQVHRPADAGDER
jgi:hypothetical protein